MPVSWYLCPYERITGPGGRPTRAPAIRDFAAQIGADGGDWRASECLGDAAVAKVRASQATLDAIAAAAGIVRIPPRFTDLTQTLGDLTSGERTAIRNKLLALGYTSTEISNALGGNLSGWRTKTLRDVLRFALTRRLKPRYDAATDTIVCDGPVQATTPVEDVDAGVA